MFQTVFKIENLKIEIFPVANFFLGLSHFLVKIVKNGKNLKIEVPGRKSKVVENLPGIISMSLTLNLEEIFFLISHPTLRTFLIFHVCGQFFENLKNFEVPGRKNQSCREFDGYHFYVLDIEFGRHFLLSHSTLRIFLIFHLCVEFIENITIISSRTIKPNFSRFDRDRTEV